MLRVRASRLRLRLRRPRPDGVFVAICTIGASLQRRPPSTHPLRQNDGRNSHRSLHRLGNEDVPPTKTAGRRDDREARGFPNRGRPEKNRPRKPQGRRRAAGAQLKGRADGVCSRVAVQEGVSHQCLRLARLESCHRPSQGSCRRDQVRGDARQCARDPDRSPPRRAPLAGVNGAQNLLRSGAAKFPSLAGGDQPLG